MTETQPTTETEAYAAMNAAATAYTESNRAGQDLLSALYVASSGPARKAARAALDEHSHETERLHTLYRQALNTWRSIRGGGAL